MTKVVSIKTRCGKTLLMDKEDHAKLSRYSMSLKSGKYPYASIRIRGKYRLLHRVIMKARKGKLVDHINHDTLDNRKANLRLCTRSQNMWNRKRTFGNSKYKGVYWSKIYQQWVTQVCLKNKRVYVERFETERAAARAYNEQATKYFGEFACLNQI